GEREIGTGDHLDRQRAIACIAGAERVPVEAQVIERLNVCTDGIIRACIRGADGKDAHAAPQLANPGAVPREVAAAGMTQAPRMRVDDADDLQSFVLLPTDAARQGLRLAVELDVGG